MPLAPSRAAPPAALPRYPAIAVPVCRNAQPSLRHRSALPSQSASACRLRHPASPCPAAHPARAVPCSVPTCHSAPVACSTRHARPSVRRCRFTLPPIRPLPCPALPPSSRSAWACRLRRPALLPCFRPLRCAALLRRAALARRSRAAFPCSGPSCSDRLIAVAWSSRLWSRPVKPPRRRFPSLDHPATPHVAVSGPGACHKTRHARSGPGLRRSRVRWVATTR